jgi:hypothetical protein
VERDCVRQAEDVLREAGRRRLDGMNVRLTGSHFNRRESKCYVSIVHQTGDVGSGPSAIPIPVVPRPAAMTVIYDAAENRQVVVFTASNLEWDSVRETFCQVRDADGRVRAGDCAVARRVAQQKMAQ